MGTRVGPPWGITPSCKPSLLTQRMPRKFSSGPNNRLPPRNGWQWRVQCKQKLEKKNNVRLKPNRLIEKGRSILVIVHRSLFFSSVKTSSVYNLRVWCFFCAKPREPSLTNTREKNISLSAQLYYPAYSSPAAGVASRSLDTQKRTSVGQKWNDESCHSSNLSILLTYDMIDFPSECSSTGLSSLFSHCGNS